MPFVNSLLTDLKKKAKHDFFAPASDHVLPDVNDLEHEVETEAMAEPSLPISIDQGLPSSIESELDTADSDEAAAVATATGGIEHQSEPEQETLTALSPSAQETGVDDVLSSKDAQTAVVAQEVETEVESETHGTDAATTTHGLAAAEFTETEQAALPTTEVFIFYS
jgi:hypothetical protein